MTTFESYFRDRWWDADVDALLAGLAAEPTTSIRLNPRRLDTTLEPEGADGRVPWCPEGVYLSQRPTFTADPLLHAGAYYVQDASSMFIAHIIRQLSIINHPLGAKRRFTLEESPSTVLDLCAAPGGKSTLLRSLLPDDALLVSNEPIRARAQVLAENMTKWGHPNVLVTQAYARDFARYAEAFDLILADVPCSGEGMMRKEEMAVSQWSPQLISQCAALQQSIIEDVWPALRPGGLLIYSTCTFNPEEDEDNVEWIAQHLDADILPIPVDPSWGICGDLRKNHLQPSTLPPSLTEEGSGERPLFCHFLPGPVRGEGFFCALLRKRGEPSERPHRPRSFDRLVTLPTDQLTAPDAPCVDVSLADAFRYLCREAIVLPSDAPRGIVQVCFRGQRLGTAKNLGTRANNLYPKEWRIRNANLTPHSIIPYEP